MCTQNATRCVFTFCILYSTFYISSCSLQKQIARTAKVVTSDSSLRTAHIGISIYEPASGKYWYNYNGDKYFVPASNTKIPTCYAAMKYLGDSLVGARVDERWNQVQIYGTADPTFLHPDYVYQPVFDYAKSKKGYKVFLIMGTDSQYSSKNNILPYGEGWPWDDFAESYMAERTFFPIYGNVVKFGIDAEGRFYTIPGRFMKRTWFKKNDSINLQVTRDINSNTFIAEGSAKSSPVVIMPFTQDNYPQKDIIRTDSLLSDTVGFIITEATGGYQYKDYSRTIYSQPTDSLLKPMMHRSDNFFAEQTLLMVSNEKIGVTNEKRMISTLLNTDFKDIPQKPRWVDGSGLSRYNLFTPQDFVFILNKMKNEFGMDRIKVILPTGGEGTLANYFKSDKGFIYAKTGSLSGIISLSGYLYTKKNKLLIFSVLINNHQASAAGVRRVVEHFLQAVRQAN